MKFHVFFYGLVATVVLLLSIGMGGFFWLTAHSPLNLLRGGEQASPAATMFIPKQAPVMVSLLVNPDRLEAFRVATADPDDRQRVRVELKQIRESLLTKRGLDYAQDIQPWIGDEITLAVTTPDFDRDQSNGQQPGYLLAIATQDPSRSREFLQLFWQKRAVAGTDLVFEQYAGVKLIYGTTTNPAPADPAAESKTAPPELVALDPPSPTLTSAVVGDRFVLFANHPKVLRDAINNVQAPDLSLLGSPAYQNALSRLPSRQVGAIFVNLPHLEVWLGNAQNSNLAADSDVPQLYESLVAALKLDAQGVLAETALLVAPGQTLPHVEPALAKPVAALQFVPPESSISAAGTNLDQLWNQLSAGLSPPSVLSALVSQSLNELQTHWGVQWSDLFGWVQQDYALGILPQPNGQRPDWVFVAQRTAAADAAIERLDAIAKQQGLSVGPLTIGDQQMSAWTKLSTIATTRQQAVPALQAEVQGVHTTVGEYEVFATSVEVMDKALNATQKSLLTAPKFRQAIAPLAAANDGYLYVDWQTARGLIEEQLPLLRLAEIAAKPLFEHLRSITVSSYGSDETLRRGATFIHLNDS